MGLKIQRRLCPEGVEPFETCQWERRSVVIKDTSGEVVFQQDDAELPVHFSELAGQIAVSKYFRGAVGTPDREYSVREVIGRIAGTLTNWGADWHYFASHHASRNFLRELEYILLHQIACFNSPVLFNLGVPDCEQQCHACFIVRAEDTMEGWMRNVREEALIFKRGSGSGLSLSPIRSSWERLTGGGYASGPISLMKILDTNAGQIKSGGRTRRAAKMHVLDVWHPDILETREGAPGFIRCKLDQEQAAYALIDAGYDGGFNRVGGAYERVFFQNANHSVRAHDGFFRAVERDDPWCTRDRFGDTVHTYQAREVIRAIAEAAWACGDPGLQYDSTIQKWHTVPNAGAINASNPCSEFFYLDNTSCNLYSLNLVKFEREDGTFDEKKFEHVCRIMTLAGEIIVQGADYPTPWIKEETQKCRPLGLGYCNLGALLMRKGLAYDSEEGRAFAGAITSLMTATAYETSAEIAASCGGPFEYYRSNETAMLNVIRMHSDEAIRLWNQAERLGDSPTHFEIGGLAFVASVVWKSALELGKQFGFRNGQASVLAPTGTISFWMDADTTGIEPDIALVKLKTLAGGGHLTYINQSVRPALMALGYSGPERSAILAYVEENGHMEGCFALKPEHLPIFDCAFQAPGGTRFIPHRGHLLMMAAVQPFVSGSISKTVNLPSSATVEDVEEVYMVGWRLGLKCVALYRDGCKRSQPLSASKGKGKKKQPAEQPPMTCPQCGVEAQKGASEKCFACPNCGLQSGCSV